MLSRVLRAFGRVARRRDWAITGVGLFAFLLYATIGLRVGIVPPSVHDEFSYLLAADTFAHGRLTNPTHRMWEHFESFHIIQRPTYQSKYPPGQGMMLAMGQVLADLPLLGAWVSTALAAAAVCWMLYGFLPPRWALVGGVVAASHPLVMQWAQSYWGGAVALAGGALVCGAYGRVVGRPKKQFKTVPGAMGMHSRPCSPESPTRARVLAHGTQSLKREDVKHETLTPGSNTRRLKPPLHTVAQSVLLGVGLALLANSRPFEGMVLAAPILIGLAIWIVWGVGLSIGEKVRWVGVPLGMVLLLTAVAMGYYNWRVTGRVWRLPYVVHDEQYAIAPPVLWWRANLPGPVYRHEAMREWFVDYQYAIYRRQQSLAGLAREIVYEKLPVLAGAYFRPWLLAAPLVSLPWILRRRCGAWALLVLAWMVVGLVSELLVWPHYAAPAGGLVIFIIVAGLREMWGWRGGIGRWVVGMVVLSLIISSAWWVAFELPKRHTGPGARRDELSAILEAAPSPQLVIVRYLPGHDIHFEWVYNRADIDASHVVWARDMGEEKNRELIEHFPGREVWLLKVGEGVRREAYGRP